MPLGLKKIVSNTIQIMGINQLVYTIFKKRYKPVILCYHRISENTLRKQVDFLKQYFEFIPLYQMLESVYEGKKFTKPIISITLDDCYEDDLKTCIKVLGEEKIHCTCFLPLQYSIDNCGFWGERYRDLFKKITTTFVKDSKTTLHFNKSQEKEKYEEELIRELGWDKNQTSFIENMVTEWYKLNNLKEENVTKVVSIKTVEELAQNNLISFQSHTYTHPKLYLSSDEEMHFELGQSKKYLENLLGQSMNIFCYPYGANKIIGNSPQIVPDYYTYAVTLEKGNAYNKNKTLIPRVGIYEGDSKQTIFTKITIQQFN